ncbi:hypothetical protein MMC07_009261 [Pseudocyphellaria aurata]|nr:hypothetical protein [Pseudocyphellaria aurata]
MPKVLSQPAGNRDVLVFDPATKEISTKKYKNLSGVKKQGLPVPSWGNYIDIPVDGEDKKRLAVRLNLSKLSWTTNIKRHCGRTSHLYVVEGKTLSSTLP